ncbi:hypothetical protein DDE18_15720 [Nocardioides gansuensis]|uniref:Uncharacterized protein n=1 Tax=Nocardioides gansuensis TaxID=2138300 RepID=A0A2T8F8S1_9ACTN|nr:hypothetical protein [Nocardioides gansuensis]PVG82124.1 hypothetical protein DDE18_15720 [Nocardioides gansuensis]
MSQPAPSAPPDPRPTPEVVADLLGVVAAHDLHHALSDLECLLAQLRAGAKEAQVARGVLRNTPAEVLRQGVRLRATRSEPTR